MKITGIALLGGADNRKQSAVIALATSLHLAPRLGTFAVHLQTAARATPEHRQVSTQKRKADEGNEKCEEP